jgi:uncharacterized protein (TIGR02147 family)
MGKYADIAGLRKDLTLTTYTDYQLYLRDLFQLARAQTAPYSYERFAADLGFSLTNVMRLVIAGKRKLAKSSALKIARALQLDETEKTFFLALIEYNNCQHATQRQKALRGLVKAKLAATPASRDRMLVEYFSKWQTPVIREMLRDPDLTAVPEQIAGRLYPSLSVSRVQESLDLLCHLGIVARKEDGSYAQVSDEPLSLPEEKAAGHLSLTGFHAEMLGISREALQVVPKKNREFNALTLNISTKNFQKLRKMIRAMCEQAVETDNQEQPRDCTVQLNVQLFMLTDPIKE